MKQFDCRPESTPRNTWKRVSEKFRTANRRVSDIEHPDWKAVLEVPGVPWATSQEIIKKTFLAPPDDMCLRHLIAKTPIVRTEVKICPCCGSPLRVL